MACFQVHGDTLWHQNALTSHGKQRLEGWKMHCPKSVDPETAWACTEVGVADKRTLSLSHKSVLMGNVNLTNFKALLERHGVQVELQEDDTLLCGGSIHVYKYYCTLEVGSGYSILSCTCSCHDLMTLSGFLMNQFSLHNTCFEDFCWNMGKYFQLLLEHGYMMMCRRTRKMLRLLPSTGPYVMIIIRYLNFLGRGCICNVTWSSRSSTMEPLDH